MGAPILLLDEALTGLDDLTAAEVSRSLAAFARGRSVLAVLGERLGAMGFDETWRLADGTIGRILRSPSWRWNGARGADGKARWAAPAPNPGGNVPPS